MENHNLVGPLSSVHVGHYIEFRPTLSRRLTTPKVSVERPPEIKARYKLFGQLADLTRKAAKDKPNLKVDVQPQWAACYIQVEGTERPVLVGDVPKYSDKIVLNTVCLRDHFDMTEEQFLAQRR